MSFQTVAQHYDRAVEIETEFSLVLAREEFDMTIDDMQFVRMFVHGVGERRLRFEHLIDWDTLYSTREEPVAICLDAIA